jgi:ubiquinone/menaquinone biosynthesis C-methylase UbiE
METRDAYNQWAPQYDTSVNKTRDLEGHALQTVLMDTSFRHCLEIGCGTGKNTEWLAGKATTVTAVDFSEEMLGRARQKIHSGNVSFHHGDVTGAWTFAQGTYDLITYSLMLEHLEHLEPVFRKAAAVLAPGGIVYVGELHPFRQYTGSKARFETGEGTKVVPCFTHHVSDFTNAAKACGWEIHGLHEFFHNEDPEPVPRILVCVFRPER